MCETNASLKAAQPFEWMIEGRDDQSKPRPFHSLYNLSLCWFVFSLQRGVGESHSFLPRDGEMMPPMDPSPNRCAEGELPYPTQDLDLDTLLLSRMARLLELFLPAWD